MTKATLRHRNLDFLYGADETEGEKQKHKTAEISRHELQREELLGRYFDDEQTLLQKADPASSAAGIMKRARETLYTKDFLPPPALLAKINDLTNPKRPTPTPLKGDASPTSRPHLESEPCISVFPGKDVGRWEDW